MNQLTTRDLKPGDILLKASDGSLFSKAITLGESMVGQLNPQVVHAGLMFDKTYIIEAQASGISANDLRVQNKPYGYIVYRPLQANLGRGAGTCAKMMFDIHKRNRALKYNLFGAIGSLFGGAGRATSAADMDSLLDRILAGKGHPFFCSQFVVYVYQFVAEQNGIRGSQLFNLSDAKVSPSVLASRLLGSRHFKEAGYIMPNER